MQRYLELAAARPPKLEYLYAARDIVKSLRFYLSEEQCYDVNMAHKAINEWRKDDHGVQTIEPDLKSILAWTIATGLNSIIVEVTRPGETVIVGVSSGQLEGSASLQLPSQAHQEVLRL